MSTTSYFLNQDPIKRRGQQGQHRLHEKMMELKLEFFSSEKVLVYTSESVLVLVRLLAQVLVLVLV